MRVLINVIYFILACFTILTAYFINSNIKNINRLNKGDEKANLYFSELIFFPSGNFWKTTIIGIIWIGLSALVHDSMYKDSIASVLQLIFFSFFMLILSILIKGIPNKLEKYIYSGIAICFVIFVALVFLNLIIPNIFIVIGVVLLIIFFIFLLTYRVTNIAKQNL
jgi:hypothetical protein